MPLFRFGAKLVLFVHIPKTGGTSVEKMLSTMGGIESLRHGAAVPGLQCTPQHFHAEILDLLIPPGFADFTFTVVRNPFARLASEFRMRVLAPGRGVPFDEWVERLFARYGNNPFVNDNHIRPQHHFVSKTCRVYRFEEGAFGLIADDLARLGLPSPASIPWERRGPDAPVAMSRTTRDKIRAFYAEDFARFGYPTEDDGSDQF